MNIKELNESCKDTLIDHLSIEFLYADSSTLKAKMPITNKTIQPMGILHGGASMALAETVGSAGSFLNIDRNVHTVVGLEINGNHVSSPRKGYVFATAKLVHKGKKTHIWTIDIHDEDGKLVSTCRITNMILEIDG